ncbi:MAG TPA: ribbon-helix-helix protein, CopG family [Arachnia sp.]|jgi:hypothetical protein|nr:ribbon-helix-helix protein, CopG family [Arachnia sp.]HQD21891.1 ribbon-helix-helix protein, CopG family [Arachnia sp.]
MSKHQINLGNGLVEVTRGLDVDLDLEEFHYDGERLTEERAERIGLEAANRGGRPHLDPTRAPSARVACRVTQPVADRLDAVARATGRRRSQVLRDALDAYLDAS